MIAACSDIIHAKTDCCLNKVEREVWNTFRQRPLPSIIAECSVARMRHSRYIIVTVFMQTIHWRLAAAAAAVLNDMRQATSENKKDTQEGIYIRALFSKSRPGSSLQVNK